VLTGKKSIDEVQFGHGEWLDQLTGHRISEVLRELPGGLTIGDIESSDLESIFKQFGVQVELPSLDVRKQLAQTMRDMMGGKNDALIKDALGALQERTHAVAGEIFTHIKSHPDWCPREWRAETFGKLSKLEVVRMGQMIFREKYGQSESKRMLRTRSGLRVKVGSGKKRLWKKEKKASISEKVCTCV
jgi:hypothetical protein